MSKTTSTETSYTSNVSVNGPAISADKIYVNGTLVRRCIVNGTDVIHKFTRTIVRAYSNLTFTITASFKYRVSTLCGLSDYDFTSPIYLDITVSGSSFTSIEGVTVATRFYCVEGDYYDSDTGESYYKSLLTNQSFIIGQQKTLTFSHYRGKPIESRVSSAENEELYVGFYFIDPDGVTSDGPIMNKAVSLSYKDGTYSTTLSGTRVVDGKIVSSTTVREY